MRSSAKQHAAGRHAGILKNSRVPSLRLHKASGRAYTVLNGKAVYCGEHGAPEAEQRYHQVIAEWLASGRQLPGDPDQITVKELIARFWLHAEHCPIQPRGRQCQPWGPRGSLGIA